MSHSLSEESEKAFRAGSFGPEITGASALSGRAGGDGKNIPVPGGNPGGVADRAVRASADLAGAQTGHLPIGTATPGRPGVAGLHAVANSFVPTAGGLCSRRIGRANPAAAFRGRTVNGAARAAGAPAQ